MRVEFDYTIEDLVEVQMRLLKSSRAVRAWRWRDLVITSLLTGGLLFALIPEEITIRIIASIIGLVSNTQRWPMSRGCKGRGVPLAKMKKPGACVWVSGCSLCSLILSCLLFVALPASVAHAQAPVPSVFDDDLKTIAGELKIVTLKESCKFNVTLDGKVILSTDCDDERNVWSSMPIPSIHTYYKSQGVRPFDEVVLLQMSMLGNACDGGPLLFLGLKRDQTFSLSERIDFCGGSPPVVSWSESRVRVLLPGGPPNRGTGYIPAETWDYENGLVKQVKQIRKRR